MKNITKLIIIPLFFLSCFPSLGQVQTEIMSIAVAEVTPVDADSTSFELKLTFNTLNALSTVDIASGPSEKSKNGKSSKGTVVRRDRKTFLIINNKSYPFHRYTVTIPVKVHKREAGNAKFFFASAEDRNGIRSKEKIAPKIK